MNLKRAASGAGEMRPRTSLAEELIQFSIPTLGSSGSPVTNSRIHLMSSPDLCEHCTNIYANPLHTFKTTTIIIIKYF